jgi:hypothetical protein
LERVTLPKLVAASVKSGAVVPTGKAILFFDLKQFWKPEGFKLSQLHSSS